MPPSRTSWPRLFTLAEANAEIAGVRERLARVMRLRAQLKSLRAALAVHGLSPSLELAFGGRCARAPRQVRRDAACFHALLAVFDEEIAAIQRDGCQIRDAEVGLVDWPALHHDRTVMLCWRLGEPSIRYWHELAAGFNGRRPVSELGPP